MADLTNYVSFLIAPSLNTLPMSILEKNIQSITNLTDNGVREKNIKEY